MINLSKVQQLFHNATNRQILPLLPLGHKMLSYVKECHSVECTGAIYNAKCAETFGNARENTPVCPRSLVGNLSLANHLEVVRTIVVIELSVGRLDIKSLLTHILTVRDKMTKNLWIFSTEI